MLGNEWEWCLDAVGDYSPATQTDPVTPWVGSEIRAVRGGSFGGAPSSARSAIRYRLAPKQHAAYIGLRPSRRIIP